MFLKVMHGGVQGGDGDGDGLGSFGGGVGVGSGHSIPGPQLRRTLSKISTPRARPIRSEPTTISYVPSGCFCKLTAPLDNDPLLVWAFTPEEPKHNMIAINVAVRIGGLQLTQVLLINL